MPLALVTDSTSIPIANRVEIAVSRRARRRGLLGRLRLDPSTALVLVPCAAIHTAFMRFPIDVIFVNKEGRAVHVVQRLRPWRIAVSAAAHGVIELAAGSLEKRDVRVGDRVRLIQVGKVDVDVDEHELEKVKACLELRAR